MDMIGGLYATVVGIFLGQWEKKKPMTIVGDGTQRRDFTHVRDIVRANILAMENVNVGRGDPINIGTGKNYSVLEVAAIIGGPIEHISLRQGEAKESLANNTKARRMLGWEPEVSFEDGIAELRGK